MFPMYLEGQQRLMRPWWIGFPVVDPNHLGFAVSNYLRMEIRREDPVCLSFVKVCGVYTRLVSSCTEPEKVGLGWVPGGSSHTEPEEVLGGVV